VTLVRFDGALPDLPTAPGWPHQDTADALAFAAVGGWTWLILDDDGRICGECGTKAAPDEDGRVEIGYGLAGPSRGRGLGTGAVATLLELLAVEPGVGVVLAETSPDNVASRRLLERLGFTLSDAGAGYVTYRRVV
jgi:RimJ/RimL family protein N-acetyltransferase